MTVSANKPPALKRRLLSSKQKRQHNTTLGQWGEQQAAVYLKEHGYQLRDHNVRFKNHELDLVVWDPSTTELVFVEVKTRSSDQFGSPALAVNRRKLASIQRAAQAYLRAHKINADYRFDTITITSGTIHHYQNITWGS